jgi:HK97 family phage prohead protease
MDIHNKDGRYAVEIKSTSADTKAPTGSFAAILSVPTVDRDGEVIDANAFNPLPERITIDVDHAMTVEKTIGSGRPYYDGEILRFEGTYASHPLAQMVRGLVDEGHINTMSVAYRAARYEVDENDGRPHLRSAELLNAGIVGIPSNREALITASKAFVDQVVEATSHPELDCPHCGKSLNAKVSEEASPEHPAAAAPAAAAKSPADVDSLMVKTQALAALAELSLLP